MLLQPYQTACAAAFVAGAAVATKLGKRKKSIRRQAADDAELASDFGSQEIEPCTPCKQEPERSSPACSTPGHTTDGATPCRTLEGGSGSRRPCFAHIPASTQGCGAAQPISSDSQERLAMELELSLLRQVCLAEKPACHFKALPATQGLVVQDSRSAHAQDAYSSSSGGSSRARTWACGPQPLPLSSPLCLHLCPRWVPCSLHGVRCALQKLKAAQESEAKSQQELAVTKDRAMVAELTAASRKQALQEQQLQSQQKMRQALQKASKEVNRLLKRRNDDFYTIRVGFDLCRRLESDNQKLRNRCKVRWRPAACQCKPAPCSGRAANIVHVAAKKMGRPAQALCIKQSACAGPWLCNGVSKLECPACFLQGLEEEAQSLRKRLAEALATSAREEEVATPAKSAEQVQTAA